MGVPVYIITGFLDSGKTRFIEDMLTDDGFTEGERTLLLVCEEGENEYDPELLKKANTVPMLLEDASDMAEGKLAQLDRQFKPERVII